MFPSLVFLYENEKKNQRYVNSIFGIYKIGMSLKEKNSLYDGTAKIGSQEHFYLKHF